MVDPTPQKPRTTLHSPNSLIEADLATPGDRDALDEIARRYAIAITPNLLSLIDPACDDDPIARQFVPDVRELDRKPEELTDPIGDERHSPLTGIIHRYPDRVLFQPLKTCPVYCRFCFRRESVGPKQGQMEEQKEDQSSNQMLTSEEVDAAFNYIQNHPEIWEVIFTGGDPLALSPRRIAHFLQRLEQIDHVKIIRLHTRVPVVDPDRISEDLVAALTGTSKPVYVALHSNHPRELTDQARDACARLVEAGIAMISQTVLLKGVNDDVETLAALMRAFVETRIKPYYLHHPDLAPGTSHFRVSIEDGQRLTQALRGRISGLAQPHYVIDIPGGFGKSPVDGNWLSRQNSKSYTIRDWRGGLHTYEDT